MNNKKLTVVLMRRNRDVHIRREDVLNDDVLSRAIQMVYCQENEDEMSFEQYMQHLIEDDECYYFQVRENEFEQLESLLSCMGYELSIDIGY